MDLEDLAPSGASLRTTIRPAASAAPVATFTHTRAVDPAELWQPHKTTDTTRDGSQGSPFGQPGHGLEHEGTDADEKASDDLVQNIAQQHEQTANSVRAVLRPGGF